MTYHLTQEENTRYFESPEHPDYWWTVEHRDSNGRDSHFIWRAFCISTTMAQIASGGAEGFHDGCRRALSAIDKHQNEHKVSIRHLDNPFAGGIVEGVAGYESDEVADMAAHGIGFQKRPDRCE